DENIGLAIQICEEALGVLTIQEMSLEKATVMTTLGTSYAERAKADPTRAIDLDKAIECYQQALEAQTQVGEPMERATTLSNLGIAYHYRAGSAREAKSEKFEQAIAAYKQALEIIKPEDNPVAWARTLNNLGASHKEQAEEGRPGDLEHAIECYQQALQVFRPEDFPDDCRRTAGDLGKAYFKMRQWPEAVSAYRSALQAAENLYQASLLHISKQAELAITGDLYRLAAYALARTAPPALQDAVAVLQESVV